MRAFEKRESAKAEETKAVSSRASLSAEAIAVHESSYSASEELAESRQRALDTIKGRINTEFNQVQSTIAARDRMLKDYKAQQKSAVAFSPSAAKSAEGEDIETLRVQLEKVRSMRDVSRVQSALKEIQRRMNDDIALMQRLKKLQ